MYPQWSSSFESRDFTTNNTQLDKYLCLTYYYLYPLREPPPDGKDTRHLEGQWEAISLFFDATPGPMDMGRPTKLTFREPARYVVISQGLERSMSDRALAQHPNDVRDWNRVERVHAHPVIYVTAGTHRHRFDPVVGSRWDPSANSSPGGGTVTGVMVEFPGPEMFLVWSAAATAAGGLIAGLGFVDPIVPVLLVTLATLFFLLWIILLIWDVINQASGEPLPTWQDNDEANGAGAQGGATEEPPAGSSAAATPGNPALPPGTANAGSPTGRDIVSFDVRLIDMLNHDGEYTGFPSPHACEHPFWWDYTGSWGINVTPAMDSDWENGTRRVDQYRRSWGYWNALRLVTHLNT
jgi:hypothetical protein